MTFQELYLDSAILKAIEEAGFVEPSPVQQEAIPLILQGDDVIAQAQTGTGKTAAFGLPVMSRMQSDDGVQMLVIVPTRELAMQVSDELYRFGRHKGLKSATVYGGTPYAKQLERIREANIVVATPGRLLDLLQSKKLNISPKIVVLDEADEMLDMGFLDEIKKIFTHLPKKRQTLMFSATMPQAIRTLADKILNDPKKVSITKKQSTNTSIDQHYFVVPEHEKNDALIRLLDYYMPTKSIVFCRTKRDVDNLATHLKAQGFNAVGLHGDMDQRQRERTIRAFKGKHGTEILVATDVAARGLDVNDVTHVINYAIPFDSESYVHRIGRTGRGGKKGVAATLVTPNELRTIKKVEKDVGATIAVSTIPTKAEVSAKEIDATIMQIIDTQVNEEAVSLVKSLLHKHDIVTVAHKLAMMVLSKKEIGGKDRIGFEASEVTSMIWREKQQNDRNRPRKRGRREFGRSFQNRKRRAYN